jgi:hypothetical protein
MGDASVFASSTTDGLPSDYSVPSEPVCEASSAPVTGVGGVLLRRIKYIGRFAYWTACHRSTRHVAWVLAFEGFTW